MNSDGRRAARSKPVSGRNGSGVTAPGARDAVELDALVAAARACRICIDEPIGSPLPHQPRPVLQVDRAARLLITGQAPGTRVHASGQPFTDPSGDRLRDWLGINADVFYDARRVAILPMGFCFPGHDGKGGDLPPRRECAPRWRSRILAAMPTVELILLVGQYAQRWHPGVRSPQRMSLTATVADWRGVLLESRERGGPELLPLPHPSWRNNAWLKANPWFDNELLAWLRPEVRRLTDH